MLPPPPPYENNTTPDITPTLQDYERLVSGCTRLCQNYNRLLYSYKNLLTQFQYIITYNYDILTHCLTDYKPPPDTEKDGVFTHYLREHGFIPV